MKKISYIENMQEWYDGFSFYIPVKVRFSETDMLGHMNNTAPFVYFEEARIEFLKSYGTFGEIHKEAESVPVAADLQCDFLQQVYFDQVLKVFVKIHYIGNTSYDLHYMAINEKEEVCLTARGRIVQINPNTGKPVEIPREIKEAAALMEVGNTSSS
ncbi:acyl-CoA thioesterase [Pontibacillus salicampi]|uniref:Acyl-CoA thioesterase n=1 Tax=Pontibacillus salicampi TaxID=1449801 RepID=A0ABV6LJ79_9BACI